jgi:hypothetical protein
MKVVTEEEMIEKGMGLIYGVGKAAPSGPRIVYLEYKGDPSSSDMVSTEAICRCLLFVGVFDRMRVFTAGTGWQGLVLRHGRPEPEG